MKKTSLILLSMFFITLSNCKQGKTTEKTKKESSQTTEQITKKDRFVLVHLAWLGGWQWDRVAQSLN